MEQQKADLSTIIDTIINDSPKDIINTLRTKEEEFYKRQDDQAKAEQEHQKQLAADQIAHEKDIEAYQSEEKQKDRDLKKYEVDENNRVKIETEEMMAFSLDKAPVEDISAAGDLALKQQELHSKMFTEAQKLQHEKDKHSKETALKEKELALKAKELASKQSLEDKKMKAEKSRDLTTKAISDSQNRLKEKEIAIKKIIEDNKNKTAIRVAKSRPKPSSKK